MATISKNPTKSSVGGSAYMEATVDIGSVPAPGAGAGTLTVEVACPKEFKYDRPVLVTLKSNQTALETGLSFESAGRVVYNSGRKIQFRVANSSSAAIDPASKVFVFYQF
jgi:hypothetical protein